MKPSGAQLRQLRKDNLAYPVTLTEIPRAQWPAEFNRADQRRIPIRVWRSRAFLVQVFQQGATLRLSINRTEWDERQGRYREDIGWDDIQKLKAEAGFGDRVAVELYPPNADVVNVANMRHIFLLDEAPAFMWRGGKAAA